MTDLPPSQSRRLAEGHYTFTFNKEPGKRRKTSGESGKEFIVVTFYFRVEDKDGYVKFHTESLVPWDERYTDILLALGGKPDEKGDVHLNDVDVIDQKFEADIVHEPDKDDSTKKWARIANIVVPDVEEEVPPPTNEKNEDEVPF